MLSQADAEFASRESAIPGLALILDTESVADALRANLPEADALHMRQVYTRYRPPTDCLVAYELQLGDTPARIYAKAYCAQAYDKLRRVREMMRSDLVGSGGLVLDDAMVLMRVFPDDEKIIPLAELANAQKRSQLLAAVLPDKPQFESATITTLHYKAERRYTGLIVADSGEKAVLKIYEERGYRKSKRVATFLSEKTPWIARPLGYSDSLRALVFSWSDGVSLRQNVCAASFDKHPIEATGRTLARFHSQRSSGLNSLPREVEVAQLLIAARAVAVTCEHLTEIARDLALRMACELLAAPVIRRPLHGDFYPDQAILTDDGIALIDLDSSVRGDPATDLGNFIARLEYGALRGDLPPNRVREVRRALLEGYVAESAADAAARIDLYNAAGLLRLAVDPFRYREPNWPDKIAVILKRIESILESSSRV
jgi:streptomycin 6-kinase